MKVVLMPESSARVGVLSDGRRVDFSRFSAPFHLIADRLGKVRDAHLAAEIGVPRQYVSRLRARLRIRRYDPLREFERVLGDVPDWRIAAAAGVSIKSVRRRRARLGVEQFRP